MEGVRILASEEVPIAWETWNWEAFWIAVGLFFVIGLVSGIIFGLQEDEFIAGLILFLVMFFLGSLICGTIFGIGIQGNVTAYETQYKVIIDDDVSMNEFYEHYEVIDQEGEIFTVRGKSKGGN